MDLSCTRGCQEDESLGCEKPQSTVQNHPGSTEKKKAERDEVKQLSKFTHDAPTTIRILQSKKEKSIDSNMAPNLGMALLASVAAPLDTCDCVADTAEASDKLLTNKDAEICLKDKQSVDGDEMTSPALLCCDSDAPVSASVSINGSSMDRKEEKDSRKDYQSKRSQGFHEAAEEGSEIVQQGEKEKSKSKNDTFPTRGTFPSFNDVEVQGLCTSVVVLTKVRRIN
jgi:hypothetical protein